MKTIHKIAIASAIASSAFVFTATPGSAQRPPRQQFCQGGTDCSFTSYASARRRLPASSPNAMTIPLLTMKVFEALVLNTRDPVTDMRSPASKGEQQKFSGVQFGCRKSATGNQPMSITPTGALMHQAHTRPTSVTFVFHEEESTNCPATR